MIAGLVDNFWMPGLLGLAVLVFVWKVVNARPSEIQADIPALADQYDDLLADDVKNNAKIAAIKRLRKMRPDLGLKDAKDVVELIVSRREL